MVGRVYGVLPSEVVAGIGVVSLMGVSLVTVGAGVLLLAMILVGLRKHADRWLHRQRTAGEARRADAEMVWGVICVGLLAAVYVVALMVKWLWS